MGFDRLKFSKNWNSATDFPTVETSETQVRADMQLLHDESRNALNALMEALEQGGSDALVRFGSDEVKYIRLNQYGGLEVSADGVQYLVVTSGMAGGAAPSTHAGQHKTGGSDPLKAADIGALPASGGILTGGLKFNTGTENPVISNVSASNAQRMMIFGGSGYENGASLFLSKPNFETAPGSFNLTAQDGRASKTLFGKPDGSLTWGGKTLIHTGNKNLITLEDIGASEKDHASQHKTGGSDPITPEDIGAVKSSGDTMTGTSLGLNNGLAKLLSASNLFQLSAYKTAGSSSNSAHLLIYNSAILDTILRLAVYDSSGVRKNYDVHHTGNKPSGSYTGNGSKESRTVDVGGIGNIILIRSTNGFALVTDSTGIIATYNSISYLGYNDCHFSNGVLTIATTNNLVNESGVTYTYSVL